MVYLIGWVFNYIVLFLFAFRTRAKLIGFYLLLILTCISFFRDSGTDTRTYESFAHSFLYGHDNTEIMKGLEPGFNFLLGLLTQISDSEVIAIRLVAVVFSLLLLVFLIRSDRSERLYFFAYFLPSFFYAYSMNVIRTGIGLAFFLLAWQLLRRNKRIGFWFYSLLAISFHYSMLVLIVLLYFFEQIKFSFNKIFGFSLIIICILTLFIVRQDYFADKLLLYLNFASPSVLSGLSKTVVIFMLLGAFAYSKCQFSLKVRYVLLMTALTVGFQVLAMYSYAGLRLLDLMAFVTPLILLRAFDQLNLPCSYSFFLGLVFTGMVNVAALYRNFIADYNGQITGTETPFLPYKTIFDIW